MPLVYVCPICKGEVQESQKHTVVTMGKTEVRKHLECEKRLSKPAAAVSSLRRSF